MAGFDLKQLPFYNDIEPIITAPKAEEGFKYTTTLSTVIDDLILDTVDAIDIIRDYKNAMGDTGFIQTSMSIATFIYQIYPYRDNLEVTISRKKLNDVDGEPEIVRYKALVLLDNDDFTNNTMVNKEIDQLLLKDITTVKLQLIERAVEPLRIKKTHGIYKNVTLDQMLKGVLSIETGKILVDGKAVVSIIDVFPANNDKVYKNIIVNSGTETIDLPELCQKRLGGLYTAGLGSYIQKFENEMTWFVYPLYHTDRLKNTKRTLEIYDVGQSVLKELDRTYLVDSTTVKIVCNKEVKYTDSAGNDNVQSGSGFRMADANAFMRKPVLLASDNKLLHSRKNLNYEVSIAERPDGLNYAPVVPISSNPYKHYSNILARGVSRMDLVWDNCDIDLLYPGMPCKYAKTINGDVKELIGTLVFVQSYTAPVNNRYNDPQYRTSAQITILIQPVDSNAEL